MSREAPSRNRSSAWRWIALAAGLLGLSAAGRALPIDQWLRAFNEWAGGLGAWGILIFVVFYVIATILLVPGSALTVGAGFVFGLGWGLLAVSLGSTTGAALAFLIARFVAREKITSMTRNNENFRRVDAAIGEQGAKGVFLLCLSPLMPFNLSNYFYGLTAVKFWPYVLASWIGMLPGTLLYVYLGTVGRAGLQAASGTDAGRSPLEWTLLVVGLAATVAVTIWVTRIARKALKEQHVK